MPHQFTKEAMHLFGPGEWNLLQDCFLYCFSVKATPAMRSVSCMQCSSVQSLQCSAVEFSAVQYSATQCTTLHGRGLQYSSVITSAVSCSRGTEEVDMLTPEPRPTLSYSQTGPVFPQYRPCRQCQSVELQACSFTLHCLIVTIIKQLQQKAHIFC